MSIHKETNLPSDAELQSNGKPTQYTIAILAEWLVGTVDDDTLRSNLDSFFSHWIEEQGNTISLTQDLQPVLQQALDPLQTYSNTGFTAALRKHIPLGLGLKLMRWAQTELVAREEVLQVKPALLDVMVKFLINYRDLQQASKSSDLAQSTVPKNDAVELLQRATTLDDLQTYIEQKMLDQDYPPFIAELSSSKLITHLRRQILTINKAASDPSYRQNLVSAWEALESFSERFSIPTSQLLRLGHSSQTEESILQTYDRYLTKVRSSANASPEEAGFALEAKRKLRFELLRRHAKHHRSTLPSLEEHCKNVLDASGTSKTALVTQLYHMFLYSSDNTLEILDQLSSIAHPLESTFEDIHQAYIAEESSHSQYVTQAVQSATAMPMADYMRLCLYDDQHGYYTRPRAKVIPRSEFMTLPEKYQDFGRGVAHDLFEKWKAIGSPATYEIVEMGAGSGKLARDILDEIMFQHEEPEWENFAAAIRYKIVEISKPSASSDNKKTLRDIQAETLKEYKSCVTWVETTADSLDTAFKQESLTGAFISNELPDAFPVHVVQKVNGELREVYVTESKGVLVQSLGPVSDPAVVDFFEDNGIELTEGEVRSVNLQAQSWVQSMSKILKQGDILIFDYGSNLGFHTHQQNLGEVLRTYGQSRNQREMGFHGIDGDGDSLHNFATTVSLVQRKLGAHSVAEAFADQLREDDSGVMGTQLQKLIKEQQEKTAHFMKGVAASPLYHPAEVDLTTDADFLSMQLEARRNGLTPVEFDTQADYFRKQRYTANDRQIYQESPNYRVQSLHKDPKRTETKLQLSPKEQTLLEQGHLLDTDDLKTLATLVANLDLGHLGKLAEAWLREGVTDELESLGLTPGCSIVKAMSAMLPTVATEDLPEDLAVFCAEIPEVNANAAFNETFETVLQNQLQQRALSAHLEARLAVDLIQMGYSTAGAGVSLEALEDLTKVNLKELARMGLEQEPLGSFHRVAALYQTVNLKRTAAGESSLSNLRMEDLFRLRDGRMQLSVKEAVQHLLQLADGSDISALLASGQQVLSRTGAIANGIAWVANPSTENFLRIRDPLFTVLVNHLGEKYDHQAQHLDTALGRRELPATYGEPWRIGAEAENTYQITRILGRYADYVHHGSRYGGSSYAEDQQTTYLRLLDPDRDTDFIQSAFNTRLAAEYSSERYDINLLKLLFEKGYTEAAQNYLTNWSLDRCYFTEEVIQLLVEYEQTEILDKYLEHHRSCLEPDHEDFDAQHFILFDQLSNLNQAKTQFQLEWNYVKNALRQLTAVTETDTNIRDFDRSYNKEKIEIDQTDASWDIFPPENTPRDFRMYSLSDISPEGEYVVKFLEFIRKGLASEQFASEAIQCIREMSASPMKLLLVEEASNKIPATWTNEQRELFLAEWLELTDLCGQQMAERRYIELREDYPIQDELYIPEEVKNNEAMLPRNHRESAYYRRKLTSAMEWSSQQVATGKIAEPASVYQEGLARLTPLSNSLRICWRSVRDEFRWRHRVYFYGGNQYVESQVRVQLASKNKTNSKYLTQLLKGLVAPSEEDYFDYRKPISHDDEWYNYYNDSVDYLQILCSFYELAVRDQHLDIANNLHQLAKATISNLLTRAEQDFRIDKEPVKAWDAKLELQLLKCKIKYAGDVDFEQQAQALLTRLNDDTREFFAVEAIAETAKDLSSDPRCKDLTVKLFGIATDKLAAKRGKADWLPPEVAESLKEAQLTSEQRDQVNYNALKSIWTEENHKLSTLFFVKETITPGQQLVFDVLDDPDSYPQSYSFLLEKCAEAVSKMDPLRHGTNFNNIVLAVTQSDSLQAFVGQNPERYSYDTVAQQLVCIGSLPYDDKDNLLGAIEDPDERQAVARVYRAGSGIGRSGFRSELDLLAKISKRLVSRRDICSAQNFERLVNLFPEPLAAVASMSSIHPIKTKELEVAVRGTTLPSADQIAAGNVNTQELQEIIEPILHDTGNPEWLYAVEALNAWLSKDLTELYSQFKRLNDKRESKDKKTVYISEADCEKFKSFQLLQKFWQSWLKNAASDEQVLAGVKTILCAKSKQESIAKAWLAYPLLGNSEIAIDVQEAAYSVVQTNYLPHYVDSVYRNSYQEKDATTKQEFFAIVGMWDHTVEYAQRPDTLWAHIFESEPAERQHLLTQIQAYLDEPDEHWKGDLRDGNNWAVTHHHLTRDSYDGAKFEDYAACFSYVYGMENHSIAERILAVWADNYDDEDRFILEKLVPAFQDPYQIDAEACWQEYGSRGLKPGWSDEDSKHIFLNRFKKRQKCLVAMQESITTGNPLRTIENRNWGWKDLAAKELLRIYDPEQGQPQTLAKVIQARFPNLPEHTVDRLVALAKNPFVTEDSGRKGDGWWNHGFYYQGEKAFHGKLQAITSEYIDNDDDRLALIALMYPYSKTYLLSEQKTLLKLFPSQLPEAKKYYEGNTRATVLVHCLDLMCNSEVPLNEPLAGQLAKAARANSARTYALDTGPVMAVAEEIPRSARIDYARQHSISISSVGLPENFEEYHRYARFLIRTYMNVLKAGTIETIGKRLKSLPADEALREFFKITEQNKLGQLLRAQPQVPQRFQRALQDVDDKVRPSDVTEVGLTIERAMNWSSNSFELQGCLNAGSMGEVWKAQHKEYDVPLALKVLTPTKLEKIKSALEEMKRVREVLGWYCDFSRESVIAVQVADKLIEFIEREVDFRLDLDNWQYEMQGKKPKEDRLKADGIVPLPGGKFWSPMYYAAEEHVLVTSFIDGVGVNQVMNQIAGQSIGQNFARDLWNMFRSSVFESMDAHFRMDLQPGNLMLLSKELPLLNTPDFNPTRVLVDTGQMGKLELPNDRSDLVDFLTSVANGDPISQVLTHLEKLGHDDFGNQGAELVYDRRGLSEALATMQESSDPFESLTQLSVEAPMHGLRLTRYLDALKAFHTLRGAITKLDPEFTFN